MTTYANISWSGFGIQDPGWGHRENKVHDIRILPTLIRQEMGMPAIKPAATGPLSRTDHTNETKTDPKFCRNQQDPQEKVHGKLLITSYPLLEPR